MKLSCHLNSATVALLLLWQYSTIIVVRAVKRHYGVSGLISCYSCMTSEYEGFFPLVSKLYNRPSFFTQKCGRKEFHRKSVGTRNCSFCLNLYEEQTFSGISVPGYIRGCMEDFKDLNSTAIYRWRRHDYCGYIDRKTLFVPRGSVALQQGAVHLCSCHTSYCNGANAAGQLPYSPQPVTSVVTLVLLTLYGRLQLLDS